MNIDDILAWKAKFDALPPMPAALRVSHDSWELLADELLRTDPYRVSFLPSFGLSVIVDDQVPRGVVRFVDADGNTMREIRVTPT